MKLYNFRLSFCIFSPSFSLSLFLIFKKLKKKYSIFHFALTAIFSSSNFYSAQLKSFTFNSRRGKNYCLKYISCVKVWYLFWWLYESIVDFAFFWTLIWSYKYVWAYLLSFQYVLKVSVYRDLMSKIFFLLKLKVSNSHNIRIKEVAIATDHL